MGDCRILLAASCGDTSSRGVGRAFLEKTDVFRVDKEVLLIIVKYIVMQEFML